MLGIRLVRGRVGEDYPVGQQQTPLLKVESQLGGDV